jgi:hypothetical protein
VLAKQYFRREHSREGNWTFISTDHWVTNKQKANRIHELNRMKGASQITARIYKTSSGVKQMNQNPGQRSQCTMKAVIGGTIGSLVTSGGPATTHSSANQTGIPNLVDTRSVSTQGAVLFHGSGYSKRSHDAEQFRP